VISRSPVPSPSPVSSPVSSSTTGGDTVNQVTLYLNFSPYSAFLTGPFKVKLGAFREKHLTPSEDYHYNGRIALGKGWLIPTDKVDELVGLLIDNDIIHEIKACPSQSRAKCPIYSKVVAAYRHVHGEDSLCNHSSDEQSDLILKFIQNSYCPSGPVDYEHCRKGSIKKALGFSKAALKEEAMEQRESKKGKGKKVALKKTPKKATVPKKAPAPKKAPVPKKVPAPKKESKGKEVKPKKSRRPANYQGALAEWLQRQDDYVTYDDLLKAMIEEHGTIAKQSEGRVRNMFNQGLHEGYFAPSPYDVCRFGLTDYGRDELLGL
jgi:hypothetical protein